MEQISAKAGRSTFNAALADSVSVEEGKIHVKSMISSKFFFPALEKWEDSVSSKFERLGPNADGP